MIHHNKLKGICHLVCFVDVSKLWELLREKRMPSTRIANYNAIPVPGPSFDGPTGELRRTRKLLAELLRRRLTTAIGVGPLPPYGSGDMLRFERGSGPGDNGRGAWLK